MEDNRLDDYKCLEDKISKKVDWVVFMWAIGIIISALVTMSGFVINLYVVFYSGLGEMKADVAVLKSKTETIEKQINSIDSSIKGIMGVFKNSKIEIYED